ncbi:hypothetical protein E3P81_02911 [Wallemia ichthyophaga]|nr:hypothetical protein E3P97_03017 [Wallemia ichthyophaga]TIB04036.1 hypothetical protein E3P96_01740 [Wallemia ichthyophaga]TIB30497.1 hypothetical protein E3P85_02711 [Wallemia ichthyophaga]TIB45317.1 hypothetical protein E3P82_02912 [Wallemia ichthyophaga]TIB48380.1 hypothetical protein E3P81_02911 [Wallemia ichthyophaga]
MAEILTIQSLCNSDSPCRSSDLVLLVPHRCDYRKDTERVSVAEELLTTHLECFWQRSFVLLRTRGGLNQPKEKPKKSILEDSDDSDDDSGFKPPAKSSSSSSGGKGTGMVAQAAQATSSRIAKQLEDAKNLDDSVFEYDEVFDQMQSAREAVEASRKKESSTRAPKYIEGLAVAAEKRKLDRSRAEEKMIQKTREREGDEYQGTEEFVTEGYKKTLEEIRLAEEEEEAREKKERDGRGTGASAFMRGILDDKEEEHAAAMKAAQENKSNVIRPPASQTEIDSDSMLKKAQSKGNNVEIDDEGQAVDKVQLLSAGLNAGKKRRAPQGPSLPTSNNKEAGFKRQAVGTDASQAAIRERHSKMVEEQMLSLTKEKEEQQKSATQTQQAKTLERRNDESAIDAAKRRFAERRAKAGK